MVGFERGEAFERFLQKARDENAKRKYVNKGLFVIDSNGNKCVEGDKVYVDRADGVKTMKIVFFMNRLMFLALDAKEIEPIFDLKFLRA